MPDSEEGGQRELPPEFDPRGRRASHARPAGSAGDGGAVGGARPPGHRRGRGAARVLSWIAVLASLAVLATSGTLYAAYRHYGGRIESLPGLGALKQPQAGRTRAENYLLVGSDSGDNLTSAQLKAIGVSRSQRNGVRTDTIILVHIPADGRAAKFISFPRDSYVAIPGHARNKLNSAFQTGETERAGGGPGKLVATIQQLSGLHVDHYLQVSLFSFATITDAIGGVDVCLTQAAKDKDANIDLPAGHQTLSGKQALSFVRQRHGLPDGDLSRIRRQQYFLGSVTRKVLSAGVLLNPLRVNRLLNAAGDGLRTDPGTQTKDLLDLALKMRKVSAGKVKFQTVPVTSIGGRADIPGQRNASVVLLDEAALPGFFARLDDSRPAPKPSGPPLTVAPASIAVSVENGTGRAGLARQVASSLGGVGFRLRQVRTASRRDYTDTVVRYGGLRAESARTVAAAIPGSVLQADSSLAPSGLVVSVGSRYTGVKKVTVAGPGARPSASPSAAPSTSAADKGCIA